MRTLVYEGSQKPGTLLLDAISMTKLPGFVFLASTCTLVQYFNCLERAVHMQLVTETACRPRLRLPLCGQVASILHHACFLGRGVICTVLVPRNESLQIWVCTWHKSVERATSSWQSLTMSISLWAEHALAKKALQLVKRSDCCI